MRMGGGWCGSVDNPVFVSNLEGEGVQPEVADWFGRRTWQRPVWDVEQLVATKAGRRVSVVLPALDEQDTVGHVVSAILPLTVGREPLVDELVVVDSGSLDTTARVAERAGARVVRREDVLSDYEPRPGKGEVLWRSLAATAGDLLVFLDSDLVGCESGFVPALLGPLLTLSEPVLVKGFYQRPWRSCRPTGDEQGGRVTELLARPLLSALCPKLSGVVQPLAGEYAARRAFLESVPFAAGYGVEIGLLLDAYAAHGLGGLAQVNLGVRRHRHHELPRLGVMARQVLDAALRRCGDGQVPADVGAYMQFRTDEDGAAPECTEVLFGDRPPLRETTDVQDGVLTCRW
jgi:glucosyl-3-phosphoglycerate synthase